MNQGLLPPFAVSVKEAQRLTGLCRTSVYIAISRGELEAVKDGGKRGKTKIVFESIARREQSLPRLQIKRR
jgi:hypothetical protein